MRIFEHWPCTLVYSAVWRVALSWAWSCAVCICS